MPLKSTRHLTAIEFETVRPLLASISLDRQEAARLCLVESKTMQVVADKFGWSRQSVHGTVERVWSTVEKYREGLRQLSGDTLLPPGWEVVSLITPSHLVARFRQMIAEEIAPRGSVTAPPDVATGGRSTGGRRHREE